MATSTDTATEAIALANASFRGCKTVRQFMAEEVRPIVDAHADGGLAHMTVQGLFFRALAWLGTFGKLDEPSDFQSVISGTRALFEIAVDLTLLVHDAATYPADAIIAWERSAKLKLAERTQRAYANRALPREHQPRIDFIASSGAAINADRATRQWVDRSGKPSHPPRWTNRDLAADAIAADKLAPHGFAEFYEVRFTELCWHTHGSGLAGVRGIATEHFPALNAIALRESAQFAMLASELTLRYVGAFDAKAEAIFGAAAVKRKEAHAEGYLTSLARASGLRL